MYNVAGVTFDNRQQNIQTVCKNCGPYIQCRLEKTYFNNLPAIRVIEMTTGLDVGWIPQDAVTALYNKNIAKIFGQIGRFEGVWYIQLYSPVYLVSGNKK